MYAGTFVLCPKTKPTHYKTTFIKVSENPLSQSLFTACVLKQSRFLKIQETYFLVLITFLP